MDSNLKEIFKETYQVLNTSWVIEQDRVLRGSNQVQNKILLKIISMQISENHKLFTNWPA